MIKQSHDLDTMDDERLKQGGAGTNAYPRVEISIYVIPDEI